MRNAIGLLICLAVLAGCTTPGHNSAGGTEKQALQIRWQRLLDEKGETCARCGTTESTTEEAVKKLRRSLKPLNIDVVLEKTAISFSTFSKDPLESNRIWIAGKPVEEWLQATIGSSQCCGACGDSECRTVTVDGKTYEIIPPELIVRAGLLASADLIRDKSATACCPSPIKGQTQ